VGAAAVNTVAVNTVAVNTVAVEAPGVDTRGESGLDRDLKDRERELILATLRVTGGNRKLTAERLGISPRTLRHKLQQFKAAGVNVPRVHQFMTV
jgi:two-component system, response regulator FlrC